MRRTAESGNHDPRQRPRPLPSQGHRGHVGRAYPAATGERPQEDDFLGEAGLEDEMTQVTDEMLDVFAKACWGQNGYPADEYKAGFQALLDAKLISLPVDESSIRESVVREAMALFECLPNHHYSGPGICAALQSLLPAQDRAEELAEAFYRAEYKTEPYPDHLGELVTFARWLIEREGVNG